jgi:hypothetical protein
LVEKLSVLLLFVFPESKILLFSFSEKAAAVNYSLFHETFLEGSYRDGEN